MEMAGYTSDSCLLDQPRMHLRGQKVPEELRRTGTPLARGQDECIAEQVLLVQVEEAGHAVKI